MIARHIRTTTSRTRSRFAHRDGYVQTNSARRRRGISMLGPIKFCIRSPQRHNGRLVCNIIFTDKRLRGWLCLRRSKSRTLEQVGTQTGLCMGLAKATVRNNQCVRATSWVLRQFGITHVGAKQRGIRYHCCE